MTLQDPVACHRTLSIMATYQCPARCDNCGTLSNPNEKLRLELNHILSIIAQAAEANYSVVVFSGGEPTLLGRDLFTASRYARSLHLVCRVVTNAHWAADRRSAEHWVKAFCDSGITELNVSTGDNHAKFIPLQNIFFAVTAALKARMRVAVMVEQHGKGTISRRSLESAEELKSIFAASPKQQLTILESPWMALSETASADQGPGVMATARNLAARSGCDSVLSVTTVQADGGIGACCGIGLRVIPELHVGNIRELTLKEADRIGAEDFLKRWLRVEGPEHILQWAETYDPQIQWEGMYAHRCQACIRLYADERVRQQILENHREKLADILLAEWLLFRFQTPVVRRRTRAIG